ncbi:hypothetical protein [Brevibacterium sp.]|uniref:hypothetical protein n=1 Tax=Brevibacterium sp. TaxID=1701 RepID=UPI0025C73472|nr:hypothetical protein [Brevibacterium sp.]
MTARALVESPFQFVSALEALRGTEEAVVHARPDARGMEQFLRQLPEGWLPPGVTVSTRPPSYAPQARTTRLLVGDLCSGRIQRTVSQSYLLSLLPELTILDDGLATLSVVEQLVSGTGPLSRPRQRLSPVRSRLSAFFAARLRGLARKGRVDWFTALRPGPELRASAAARSVRIREHRFEHARSVGSGEAPESEAVVIGSAMAADGLIRPAAYLDWVRGAAGRGTGLSARSTTYYPHRRESPDFLARVAQLEGVRVAEPGLPLELRLSSLPPGVHVLSLPSTAVVSLATMNPEAVFAVTPVEPAWWTDAAPAEFRASTARNGKALREWTRQTC